MTGKDAYNVPPVVRAYKTAQVRGVFPAIPPSRSRVAALPSAEGLVRHRFFYFSDYEDLANQLVDAGWLLPEQGAAVGRAAARDRLPDPLYRALRCDLTGMRAALEAWSPFMDEA